MFATRVYVALQNAGKGSDADAFANKWIDGHTNDPTFPQLLAEQSQRKKDYAAAIVGYKRVLGIDGDNVVALNNLAWLLTMEKDPAALEYAEQAHRLAPLNHSVLDTLGFVLIRNGDAKRAVPLLRMASSLAPTNSEIRLHLAQALADTGDKQGARRELAELMKPGAASSVRVDAEKLQATL
jgi:predicted Zn-dependent protease